MKFVALFPRFGARCVALLLVIVSLASSKAQPAPEPQPPAPAPAPAAKPSGSDELSQAELLKSYLQVREQLHATQLAVVNNRVEAEAAARVQTAAIAEKLESLASAMTAERDRHQAETLRLHAERERQQVEAQRSMRTVLWIAAAFGGLGLLSMLVTPLFQWRAIHRMAETTAMRPALVTAPAPAFLAGEAMDAADRTVALSNRRLASVVERMEARIIELEHTAGQPLPVVSTAAVAPVSAPDETVDPPAHLNGVPVAYALTAEAKQIALLMGKARTLVTAGKVKEALACYDEILALDSDHTETLVKKGAALERLIRNEEAIRCYDRAIELDGKMTLAYLYKGGVCNRLGRYDEALECYEQALQAQEQSK